MRYLLTHACTVDPTVPKLQSLTFRNVDISSKLHQKLLETLEARQDHHVGLKSLDFQSCSVLAIGQKAGFEELVKEVTWDDVVEMDPEYLEVDSEEVTDSDEDELGYHCNRW